MLPILFSPGIRYAVCNCACRTDVNDLCLTDCASFKMRPGLKHLKSDCLNYCMVNKRLYLNVLFFVKSLKQQIQNSFATPTYLSYDTF